MHILHVEAIIMAYFVHFCAYNCIFKAYFCIFPDIFAHLLHMSAYFRHIFEFCCLFQLILCISMHIYCIFEYTNAYKCIFHLYRSHALASSGPFLVHSCSTSQQQPCINTALPVNTLTTAGQETLTSVQVLGLVGESQQQRPAAPEQQPTGLSIAFPSICSCQIT